MTQLSQAQSSPAHPLGPTDGPLSFEELQLAFRNRGMPLEALRYDLTPTGLHYLVIHWDIPDVDVSSWRLEVGGRVRRRLELSLADIGARAARTLPVTLECAGNGRARLTPRPLSVPWLSEAVGTAEWTGTPLWPVLEEAEAVREPFEGFQQAVAYRYQRDADDPGEPVSRIRVRALMIPPGVPDFYSRTRFVEPGTVPLAGRAWSGDGPIERVEVGLDGAWSTAQMGPAVGEFAWHSWSFEWDATTGDHELACRATDAAGNVQPVEQPWNYQGMGNNLVQTVAVTVRT